MSFLVRPAREEDLDSLYLLSSQFVLINLPANRYMLEKKIEISKQSFLGELTKEEGAEYLFVLEDTKVSEVVACSMILAKHGSPDYPHFSFEIHRQERTSEDLGIGFIHHVLRLQTDEDGPTEVGALILDGEYRSRPEKLGKTISFSRFLYMGLFPEKFEKRLLCEFAPKLTEDGRSLFWEALGRKFTGLTYIEADKLSLGNKEFIRQLFPITDIYLALLDPEVRMNLGKVSESTEPAKHLLEGIGFKYLQEMDPFDGGPHYGAELSEISIVKNKKEKVAKPGPVSESGKMLLVCNSNPRDYRAMYTKVELLDEDLVQMNIEDFELLNIASGDKVYYIEI